MECHHEASLLLTARTLLTLCFWFWVFSICCSSYGMSFPSLQMHIVSQQNSMSLLDVPSIIWKTVGIPYRLTKFRVWRRLTLLLSISHRRSRHLSRQRYEPVDQFLFLFWKFIRQDISRCALNLCDQHSSVVKMALWLLWWGWKTHLTVDIIISQIYEELDSGKPSLRLLYVTPELIDTGGFIVKLRKLHARGLLTLIAIDEASHRRE